MSEIVLVKAKNKDLKIVYDMYLDVISHLEATKNLSGWKKGIYPTNIDADLAFEEDNLFLLRKDDDFLGTVILNHNQAIEYKDVVWSFEEKTKKDILVIHTFCINPIFSNKGHASTFLSLIKEYATNISCKSIRLDASFNNTPAHHLYLKNGYTDIGKIHLNLEIPREGFYWWHAMELML